MSGIPTRSVGYHDAADDRLNAITDAVAASVADGMPPSAILGRVANGLTGAISGYEQRALVRRWMKAWDLVTEMPLEDLKDEDRAMRATRR